MGQEPKSLFIYGDSSLAARGVREAIYDGPYDLLGFEVKPVILEKKPQMADGDAALEPVKVNPGDFVVDSKGDLVSLTAGVAYSPSGCTDSSCVQTYQGDQPATLDQLVVHFKLKSGIRWADGTPLMAADSVYSFEVAKALYPGARSDLIRRTQSYQALDDTTVEWRGVPGYLDPLYATNFFTPLPQHAWGSLAPEELMKADVSNRSPMGWGPYVIDDWVSGDHISLHKNPNYFRSEEGLPHFDNLIFRFMANGEEAISALLAGECDFIDETVPLESQRSDLLGLQDSGRLKLTSVSGTAWEHADFGIASLDSEHPNLFQSKTVRQAIAMCIDRQQIADALSLGQSQVPDTYALPIQPLYDSEVSHYAFVPQEASALLESVGWMDADQNPGTPRLAQGVPNVPDGTPFEFSYITVKGGQQEQAAQLVGKSLAQCGIQVDVTPKEQSELFAPGPDGPIFGRHFAMAQFGWTTAVEPSCFLYTSQEIPGPYPDYSQGWGGANDSGYSNPEFDQACNQARLTLPDMPGHQEASRQAQEIFAQDLPSIPLYLHQDLVVMRPDICGVALDPLSGALWNIEAFDEGQTCGK